MGYSEYALCPSGGMPQKIKEHVVVEKKLPVKVAALSGSKNISNFKPPQFTFLTMHKLNEHISV